MRPMIRLQLILLCCFVLMGQTGSCTLQESPGEAREAVEMTIEEFLPEIDRPRRVFVLPTVSIDGNWQVAEQSAPEAEILDRLIRDYLAFAAGLTNRLQVSRISGEPLGEIKNVEEREVGKSFLQVYWDANLTSREKAQRLVAVLNGRPFDALVLNQILRTEKGISLRIFVLLRSPYERVLTETIRFPPDAFTCRAPQSPELGMLCAEHQETLADVMDSRRRRWGSVLSDPPWINALRRAKEYIRANPVK